MEEKLQEILEGYGLKPDEVKVYLAMLISDQTSILKISEETSIKRSTVYLIIKNLMEMNLVRVAIVGKKKSYFAKNPKVLLEMTEKRKHALEEVIPLLKEHYKTHREKPKVTFFEGREGVERVYEEIADLRTDQEILWFSSQQDMMEEFYGSHMKLDDIKRMQANPDYKGSRIIVNPTKGDREYAKKIMHDRKLKNLVKVRLLPKDLLFVHTDNCIYDNKLAIFSIKRDYFVFVIESEDIASTYRALFNLAWLAAIKVN